MAKARDPIVRLSKHDVLPEETLAKAAQVILDAQLRHVERTRKVRFDETPNGADPEAHRLYLDDMPEVRLLQKLWLRYHALQDADDPDQKAINEVLKMITHQTAEIAASRTKSFEMILSVVAQRQKAKEHNDRMAIAAKRSPGDLKDAELAELAGLGAPEEPQEPAP